MNIIKKAIATLIISPIAVSIILLAIVIWAVSQLEKVLNWADKELFGQETPREL